MNTKKLDNNPAMTMRIESQLIFTLMVALIALPFLKAPAHCLDVHTGKPPMPYERIEQEVIDEDLHVKIFKTKTSPRFYIQYNVPGKGQVKKSLRTTSVKEARSKARKIARDLEAGHVHPVANRAASIAQVAEKFLKDEREREGVKAETIILYRRYLDQLLAWGGPRGVTTLTHLTEPTLRRFEKDLRTTGVAKSGGRARPNSQKSIRDKLKVIRHMTRFALQNGLLGADPAPAYRLPAAPDPKIEIFTAEELQLVLGDPDPGMRLIWHAFALTGMRSNELCWLTLEDDDRDQELLHIRPKTCPITGEPWQPKHDRSRALLVLDPLLREVLDRARALAAGPWLFARPAHIPGDRSGRWTPQQLWWRLKGRLETLGLAHRGVHGFRHTYLTFLANRPEVPLPHVQQVAGHRSIQTTMRYVHPSRRDVHSSLAQVDFQSLLCAPGGQRQLARVTEPVAAGASPAA